MEFNTFSYTALRKTKYCISLTVETYILHVGTVDCNVNDTYNVGNEVYHFNNIQCRHHRLPHVDACIYCSAVIIPTVQAARFSPLLETTFILSHLHCSQCCVIVSRLLTKNITLVYCTLYSCVKTAYTTIW
jgi:hypothetical protein